MFSEEPVAGPSGFDITPNPDGSVTVTDIASAALIAAGTPFPKGDGIDTLWNIENLRFCTGIDPTTKKCIAFQDVPIGAPAAPLNVTALALNGGALVSWTEPAAAAAVSSFDVRVFANGNLVKTVTVPPTDTSAIITGLANGTAFTFKVRANGKGGHGADSDTSAPVTPQAPQVTPRVLRRSGQPRPRWVPPASAGPLLPTTVVP